MAEQPGPPDLLVAAMARSGHDMTLGWMRLLFTPPPGGPSGDWMKRIAGDSPRVAAMQTAYLEKQAKLWAALSAGLASEPVAAQEPGDRRFVAKEWRENPFYDYIRQSYLLASRYLNDLVDGAELKNGAKDRVRFAVRQWLDAMSPANFIATNPEALRHALETKGESLSRGLANLIGDVQRGHLSQTDESAFEVGRNLATTPGQVVFENELMQLIQYAPSSAGVAKRPLVMVPPCINKYYILDLQPENSFVRYAVAEGHTVFMVSWRNAGPEIGHLTWDDYIDKGVLLPMRIAREIAAGDRVNVLGFCVGGTLLGAALAVLAARQEELVESVTYLTTMLDFSEPGQIGLFVDDASHAAREAIIGRGGILPGSDLALVFSALRANDLVWPYVINNYLMGGSPAAFDLLFWNSDSTNLPGPMYCYYVRNTYLRNRLRAPNALTNCGVPVDLGRVKLPSFIFATREDHIVPWRAAYRSIGLLGGEKTFVLGASGHVAGVINPAVKNRRSYWMDSQYPAEPDTWLAGATQHQGSWWPRWSAWMEQFKGGTRKAPAKQGNRKYKPIEPAPGRYVKQKAPAVAAPNPMVAAGRRQVS